MAKEGGGGGAPEEREEEGKGGGPGRGEKTQKREGWKQREGEGREVNLFIHPPTSRSPAPAASTGSNGLAMD